LKVPVHGLGDVSLLAEAVHWVMSSDPAGMTDESLAEGPANDARECDEALVVLLRGICD